MTSRVVKSQVTAGAKLHVVICLKNSYPGKFNFLVLKYGCPETRFNPATNDRDAKIYCQEPVNYRIRSGLIDPEELDIYNWSSRFSAKNYSHAEILGIEAIGHLPPQSNISSYANKGWTPSPIKTQRYCLQPLKNFPIRPRTPQATESPRNKMQ